VPHAARVSGIRHQGQASQQAGAWTGQQRAITDISSKVRQIAVKNIGRDEPTLITTSDLATPGKEPVRRYAEWMMVENETPGGWLDQFMSGAAARGYRVSFTRGSGWRPRPPTAAWACSPAAQCPPRPAAPSKQPADVPEKRRHAEESASFP
jgi:hypothetical protein